MFLHMVIVLTAPKPPILRDLKPYNILVDTHGNCRLGDFGHAAEDKNGNGFRGKCGTTGYQCPEVSALAKIHC